MGIVSTIICADCKEEKDVAHSLNDHPLICTECKDKKETKEVTEHFDKLNKMTLSERLRCIEKYIYEQEKKKSCDCSRHKLIV